MSDETLGQRGVEPVRSRTGLARGMRHAATFAAVSAVCAVTGAWLWLLAWSFGKLVGWAMS